LHCITFRFIGVRDQQYKLNRLCQDGGMGPGRVTSGNGVYFHICGTVVCPMGVFFILIKVSWSL
jgi:hypothetical protein